VGARQRAGEGANAVVRQAVTVANTASTEVRARTGNGQGGPPQADDRLVQLERLARLRDAGTLDETEFQAEKSRILAGQATPT
jgi:hypothetical protein